MVSPSVSRVVAPARASERTAPCLSVDPPGLTATPTRLPRRCEVPVLRDEQLIVEFCSRWHLQW